ncbi:hypothetical protein P4O66_015209 [Electrophorus voltai]|uniref:Uncharacterized protein n=1 Tax=Electrophorus voltai TaxID=2609070 RepID=A0AAD8YYT3_9TELE|nr:hypothetical protein P4O66_015209 [Electrophorus voltai]
MEVADPGLTLLFTVLYHAVVNTHTMPHECLKCELSSAVHSGESNLIVLLICVLGAVILILLLAVIMKIMLRRREVMSGSSSQPPIECRYGNIAEENSFFIRISLPLLFCPLPQRSDQRVSSQVTEMPSSVTSAVSMVSSDPGSSPYRAAEAFTVSDHPPSLPSGPDYLHLHTDIIIIVIFGMVCFLLLVAFFYAFCVHCTLQASAQTGPALAWRGRIPPSEGRMQTTHSSLTRQRQQQARALCREARGDGLNLGKKVSVPKDVMMEELNLTSNRGSRMFQERQRRVDRFTVENTADTSTVSYDNLDHNQGHSAAPVQGGKENLSCLVPGKRSLVTTLKKSVAMKGSPGVLAAGYTGPLKEIPREKFNITVIPRSYCSPWREALGECEEIPASLNTQPEKLQPVNYRCFNRSPMPFGGRTHSKRVTTPISFQTLEPQSLHGLPTDGTATRPNFNRAPRGWGIGYTPESTEL